MIGKRFGERIIIGISVPETINGKYYAKKYLMRCDCGDESYVFPGNIRKGSSPRCRSCTDRLNSLLPNESMIGKKFNSLTVISRVDTEKENHYFNCLCDCGNTRVVCGSELRMGRIKKCTECKNASHVTHGKKGSSIYNIHMGILARIRNPNCPAYKNYGGRGITICDRWLSFENFYEDMGDRPKGKQIDRIDNDKGYFKENCRWVTPKQNCKNRKRKSIDDSINGEIR